MENKKWEQIDINMILRFKGGFISYNPDTDLAAIISPLGIFQDFGNAMGLKNDKEETALAIKNDKMYILNGDFRKDYEKCKNIKEMKLVYKKNIKHKSDWSEDNKLKNSLMNYKLL